MLNETTIINNYISKTYNNNYCKTISNRKRKLQGNKITNDCFDMLSIDELESIKGI